LTILVLPHAGALVLLFDSFVVFREWPNDIKHLVAFLTEKFVSRHVASASSQLARARRWLLNHGKAKEHELCHLTHIGKNALETIIRHP
jgi:hypothetical protein